MLETVWPHEHLHPHILWTVKFKYFRTICVNRTRMLGYEIAVDAMALYLEVN